MKTAPRFVFFLPFLRPIQHVAPCVLRLGGGMPHIAKWHAHAHTADLSRTTPAASSRAAGLPPSLSPPSLPRPNQPRSKGERAAKVSATHGVGLWRMERASSSPSCAALGFVSAFSSSSSSCTRHAGPSTLQNDRCACVQTLCWCLCRIIGLLLGCAHGLTFCCTTCTALSCHVTDRSVVVVSVV
jgi:hypothetical protein